MSAKITLDTKCTNCKNVIVDFSGNRYGPPTCDGCKSEYCWDCHDQFLDDISLAPEPGVSSDDPPTYACKGKMMCVVDAIENRNDFCRQVIRPITTVSRVGQTVRIDWTGRRMSGLPKYIPDVREFQVTEIVKEHCFRGFTVGMSELGITEIYFDTRGGWTEIIYNAEQGRNLYYSHPFIEFLD